MTVYNNVISFGGIFFRFSSITPSEKPSALKTNMGKMYSSKDIPLRDANDIVLNVSGIIEGLSQTSGQTKATAIENDRTSLNALNDGYKHAYDDGKHSGDFVIVTGSLSWEDDVNRIAAQPNKFSMVLISWQ